MNYKAKRIPHLADSKQTLHHATKIWKFLERFGKFHGCDWSTLFRMTNPETEDPEVIPITGPPT